MTRDEGSGSVAHSAPSSSSSSLHTLDHNAKNTEEKDYSEEKLQSQQKACAAPVSFQHCQSIYQQTPSQAAFTANNAYDPSTASSTYSENRGTENGIAIRPTASTTANYFDLLDALISSAFDHKRTPGSAEAYAILVDMITPPEFEEKTSCAECFEIFSMTNFRHHCRNCGRSICRTCSSLKNKRIPKYGYTDPVRVR